MTMFPEHLERVESAIFKTPGVVQIRASGAGTFGNNSLDNQSRSPATLLQFPSGVPSHGRDSGGCAPYPWPHAPAPISAQAHAAENVNLRGFLNRWSFARVKCVQQAARGLTQGFRLPSKVIVRHERNVSKDLTHEVQRNSACGAQSYE